MRGFIFLFFASIFLLSIETARAEETPPPVAAPTRNVELYQTRPLDGVLMNAIETYPNARNSSLGIGVGVYPFNPYYTGFMINGNFSYRLSRTVNWEIFNVSYALSYHTALTTELAQNYNVNPKSINYLTFIVNTDIVFDIATGKFVALKEYLRYFTFSALLGGGFADSDFQKDFGPVFGFRTEVYASANFSWRLDVRDTMTINNYANLVVFSLNMGLNF
jgi:hypothetical protein